MRPGRLLFAISTVMINNVDPDIDNDGLPNGIDPNVDGGLAAAVACAVTTWVIGSTMAMPPSWTLTTTVCPMT